MLKRPNSLRRATLRIAGLLSRILSPGLRNKKRFLEYERHLSNSYYLKAAKELEIKVDFLGDVVQFSRGKKVLRLWEFWLDVDSLPVGKIAADKALCSTIFEEHELPAPAFCEVVSGDWRNFVLALKRFRGLVAIKPTRGTGGGRGVAAGIDPRHKWRSLAAFFWASTFSNTVMVEEFVPGDNYRFLVFGSRVISAVKRLPCFVIGDGKSTIASLVACENAKRERKLASLPSVYDPPILIPVTPDYKYLKRKGLDRKSVPDEEEVVQCRSECNYSYGGVYIDVTDEIHETYKELAVKAAEVIGIRLAGVDMIIGDPNNGLSRSNCIINEINTTPGPSAHYEVINNDKAKDIAKTILYETLIKD